jgi:hypothetical protein
VQEGLASAFSAIEKRLEKHHENVMERRMEGLWREDSLEAPDTPNLLDALSDAGDNMRDAMNDLGKTMLVSLEDFFLAHACYIQYFPSSRCVRWV